MIGRPEPVSFVEKRETQMRQPLTKKIDRHPKSRIIHDDDQQVISCGITA